MKISRNWIQTYVDISGVSDDEICRGITFLGFEVEQVIRTGAPALKQVYVGEVLVRDKHPNADKLSVCQVNVGPVHGVKTIVCGAQNYVVGDRVPVALAGAVLPGDFTIKQSKIRGQLSDGMMCSAKELGVAEDAAGLLILPGRPEIGAAINEVLPPGDVVFDVEVTPNRPDCQSHLGLARELAAWLRQSLAYPSVRFTPASVEPQSRPDLLRDVRIDAAQDCPLYTATVISGVKVGPSPEWMQQRLEAVGLRPVNNIVDIGNYVTLEYGQPVHAFDARKIGGAQIVVRHAAKGEKLVTLDGKERVLAPDMLVIADEQRPLVVAGIMGGVDSGVSEATTELVLEVAYFRPQSIRSTSRRLGVSSDSSYRYERGVDVHSLDEAMHRCIDLILELAGGKVMGPTLRVGTDIPWQREITFTAAYVNEKLGFEIPEAEMRRALESLELTLTREEPTTERGTALTVEIPSWRSDLDRPIDLVEEILRLHGTEKIPVDRVLSPGLIAEDDPIVMFNRRVTELMVGRQFQECVNYTLRSGRELAGWAPAGGEDALKLANPFIEDQSHLRPTLVAGLLESLRLNQSRGTDASRLFETGRVFIERDGRVWECVAVAFVQTELAPQKTWLERAPADFYAARRHVEALAAAAGIDLARQAMKPLQEMAAPGWQSGHAAVAGELAHGWTVQVGLLDLAATRSLGIQGKVYGGCFAILPEKLPAEAGRRRFQTFSLFPSVLRDLALVVPAETPAAEVQKTIGRLARAAVSDGPMTLEDVRIFDVYQGKGLPEGSRSLAFNLIFRSTERTLTDDEVNRVFTRIQDEVQAGTMYQIRK